MRTPLVATTVLALAVLAARLGAIMLPLDVRYVPVDRLLTNLERLAKQDPLNPDTQINIARVHAMAYALKQEAIDMRTTRLDDKDEKTEVPQNPPPIVQPDLVRPAPTAEHAARATEHLKRAIQHYDNALKLSADNMTALLGRGWARRQAGDTAGAIADLRRVVEIAWPKESKKKVAMPSERFLTQEAAGYLIPLLDRSRDAAEIRDLTSKQADLKNLPRAITPIAVPFDDVEPRGHAASLAHGASLVDPYARVHFDADGSALDREWTWLTRRAGWLVYDGAGRGQIMSALQLFGNVTFWLFWNNGYDALRALDDDGSGGVDGGELRHLAVWHDLDADGRSERGEVLTLESLGIIALSYDHCPGDGERIAAYSTRGITLRDGRTRPTYDVILRHTVSRFTN